MFRAILIALLACVVTFSASAATATTVAKGSTKSLTVLSSSLIGKVFSKKSDKRSAPYHRLVAKKKRKAQSHRRSLLRSQSTR